MWISKGQCMPILARCAHEQQCKLGGVGVLALPTSGKARNNNFRSSGADVWSMPLVVHQGRVIMAALNKTNIAHTIGTSMYARSTF